MLPLIPMQQQTQKTTLKLRMLICTVLILIRRTIRITEKMVQFISAVRVIHLMNTIRSVLSHYGKILTKRCMTSLWQVVLRTTTGYRNAIHGPVNGMFHHVLRNAILALSHEAGHILSMVTIKDPIWIMVRSCFIHIITG